MDAKDESESSSAGVIHEFDGIQECDNALPRWWLALLWGTLAFGAFYWLACETFKAVPSPRAAYREEMDKLASEQAERMKTASSVSDERLMALAKDGKSLSEGKSVFASTCAPCHAASGGGGIGPNLTDSAWLHGSTPTKVYATIKEGVVAKGMPAWSVTLGEERVRLVAAYVVSLNNTNVPGGKAPQGTAEN